MSRNRFVSLFVGLALLAALPACQTGVGRAAVSLRLNRAKATPKDAGVWITGDRSLVRLFRPR